MRYSQKFAQQALELGTELNAIGYDTNIISVRLSAGRWAASFSCVGSSLNRIYQHSVSSVLRMIDEGIV
jgi:hypothetical protein